MLGKNLFLFIKAQKKYVLLHIIAVTIIGLLLTWRSYTFADMLYNLIKFAKSGEFDKFVNATVVLMISESLLFFFRVWHVALQSRYRGYMNMYVRIFGLNRIVEKNYQDIAKLGSGKLMQIIQSGNECYTYIVYDGIKNLLELMVGITALVVLLAVQSWRFIPLFFVGIAISVILQKLIFLALAKVRENDVKLNEEYNRQTAKVLVNFVLMKIFNIKEQELKTLENIGKHRVDNYQWIKFRFNAASSVANLLFIVLMLGAIWYLGVQYKNALIDEKTFFIIGLLFTTLRTQLFSFGSFITELSEKLTSIKRFDDVTDIDSKIKKNDDSCMQNLHIDWSNTTISFDKVAFGYDNNLEPIIDEFSLKIPHGQKLAIIGRSGSGKSTILKLLAKLIDPQSGSLYIGGLSIEDISLDKLYHHVGFFYQEPLVFDGKISDNVTLGLPVPIKKVNEALRLAHLDHLYPNTIVGEHGLLLSGGEKQRLALARAFVFDYDVLLLDEPTSNLDPELEQEVLLNIFKHYANKTVIVISHRPFILDFVDRVIVIKKGIITADGSRSDIKKLI